MLDVRELQLKDTFNTLLKASDLDLGDNRRADAVVLGETITVVDVERNKVGADVAIKLEGLVPLQQTKSELPSEGETNACFSYDGVKLVIDNLGVLLASTNINTNERIALA